MIPSFEWIECLASPCCSCSSCCCCCCGGGGACSGAGGAGFGGGACSVETALTICLTDWPKEEISCDCAVSACWEVDRGLEACVEIQKIQIINLGLFRSWMYLDTTFFLNKPNYQLIWN